MKVSPQVLESLARIGYSEKPLVDHLNLKLDELKSKLLFQTDIVQMRILQGRAQEISELCELIKTAPELVRKA